MNNESFAKTVEDVFRFVTDEYAFQLLGMDTSLGQSIVYESPRVRLEINCYKGEVDEYFAPRCIDGAQPPDIPTVAAFDVWRHFLATDDNRPLARWNATDKELQEQLQYDAGLIRKYCEPILNGDIDLIKEVARKKK